MKKINKWRYSSNRRMARVIVGLSIFIAGAFFFIRNELVQNQVYFLRSYEQEQQLLVDQVAIRLNTLLASQPIEDFRAIEMLEKEVNTSGSRFWFLSKNSKILLLKNKETTKFYKKDSLETVIEAFQKEPMHISSYEFTIGENQYKVGVLSKESYILEKGKVLKHNLYIFLVFMILCLIFFALLLWNVSRVYECQRQINSLDMRLTDKNLKIDSLHLLLETKPELLSVGEKIYERDVFDAILKTIMDERLLPITIILIDLRRSEIDNVYRDFHKEIELVSNMIHEEHIVAEIKSGTFSFLLFRSNLINVEMIENELVNRLSSLFEKTDITVQIETNRVESLAHDLSKSFEVLYKKVVSKREVEGQEGQ